MTRGKLALTEENPANIKWLLVKAGALGAINTFTENPGLADGRQWINAWGDDGWVSGDAPWKAGEPSDGDDRLKMHDGFEGRTFTQTTPKGYVCEAP